MELEYQLDRALSKIHVLEVSTKELSKQYEELSSKHEALKESYGTMLVWVVNSSVSPLRADEVENLIKMLK